MHLTKGVRILTQDEEKQYRQEKKFWHASFYVIHIFRNSSDNTDKNSTRHREDHDYII